MRSPWKVLMLVENLPVPADRRVWAEATTLRDAGFQVTIISPAGTTDHQELSLELDGIHIYRYRLPATGNGSLSYIREYATALLATFGLTFKVLRKHGFEIIHAANPPDMFCLIGLFYKLAGKKFIFDQHDLAPEMFEVKFKSRMKPIHRLLLLFENFSYRVANHVIVTNQSQKRNAILRGHCHPEKVSIVRNGPDIRRMKRGMPEPDLKQGRPYMLAYLGAMGKQDGIEYALQALHILVHEKGRQDVSMVLMGDGEYAPALHKLAHTLELDNYVNFTGWIKTEDVIRYLTVADIGISPDPKNGLNEKSTMIKTMEYMAMSLPVVAFDLAETRFTAQDAALYAPPNDVYEFTNHLNRLLNDEQLRARLGTVGRQRVEEELSWQHSKKQLIQVYKKLFPRHFVSTFFQQVDATTKERSLESTYKS